MQVVSCCVRQYPGPAYEFVRFVSYEQKWGCVLCSETLVSSRPHISELMVPGFGRPMQLFRGEVDRFRELAVHVRDGFSACGLRGYEYGSCEIVEVRICSSSHKFYVFSAYRNPDVSDKTFDCLLIALAKMQSVDKKTVTESTHIDERVLDLVLTDIADVVGIRVGSPIGTSVHSSVFTDVVLEQPVLHLVCKQAAYIPRKTLWTGSWLEM